MTVTQNFLSLTRFGHTRGGNDLDGVTGFDGVVIKHLHGFEGKIAEVFSKEIELAHDVVCDGDDVAADLFGVKDVEQLAGAGPNQLGVFVAAENFHGFGHHGKRIAAGVGDASSEDGDVGRRAAVKSFSDFADLREGQQGGGVDLNAVVAEAVH